MTNIKSGILARFHAPITRLALSLCAIGIASAAQAADYDWTGGGTDTNYSTPENWGLESGYPGSADGARFLVGAASKTVTFNGAYTPSYVWTATGNTASPVTWEGSGSVTTTWNIGCADNVGQVGALTINSGTYNAGGGFNFGSGTGVLTMNGGTVNAGGVSYWGTEANADFNATINSGATVNFNGIDGYTSLRMMNGTGIAGVVNIDGGTVAVNGGDLELGLGNSDATSQTTINISNGGVLSVGNATERWTIIGSAGTGKATINVNEGGKLSFWRIAHTSTGECELNVDGGTLEILGKTWNYDGGTFAADNDASFTVTIGEHGATLDTNGFDVKIPKVIKGTGTLTLTGGGSVLFTAQPECTIVADGATYTIEDDKFYWTGASTENSYWSNPDNWRGGVAPNSADATVVIPDGAVITLTADATVGTATINGTVTLTTSSYFLRADNISSGNSGMLILSNAKLAGISANSAISVPLKIEAETENQLYTANAGGQNGYPINVTSDISGEGKLIINAYCSNGSDSNVNAGISLSGDNSGFRGIIEYRLGAYGSKFQQRQRDVLAASASSEDADWMFYTNYSETPPRNNGLLFSTENGVYKFGSAQINLPQSAYTVASGVSFVIGKKNADSFIKGTWGKSVAVEWVASTATLMNSAANTGSITLSGGGNLTLAASGIPAAINFSENGGYIVLTDDDALNASILAAVSTIADGATFGFVYDGANEISLDLSGKAALLAGKKIAKKGSGALYVAGLPSETACDVDVNEGALVLPHGAVVGDVTVAQGASLVVDLIGAVDDEVVFAYGSASGDMTYRNKPSSGEVVVDDIAKTWTYTVTGVARTFTWNGADGASWNDASNWLVDGEPTIDVPSAIDTVLFSNSAKVSASGTIAGDVQIASGVTLTIPAGLTFTKLTAESGATIAFSSVAIATVGGTLTLITVGEGSGVSDAFVLPPMYGVSVDAGTGAITATRNAAAYMWTGSVDNNWAASGNWSVNGSAVVEVPAAEDDVVFPTSDADGFEGWTVSLPWDVYADTVTLNANVVLSGARTLKAHTIIGTAELKLSNANLGSNGAALDIYCPLNVMPETTNYIYLQKYDGPDEGNEEGNAGEAYIVNLRGPLYGSGVLTADHAGVQGVGVKFYGDNRNFWGTFTSSNYNSRDCTDMGDYTSSSSNAVWNVYTYNNNSDQAFIVHGTDTYYFGALNGGLQMGSAGGSKSPNETVSIEVGARDDVASTFALASHVNYNKGYDVSKVGANKMSISGKGWAGGNSVFRLNSLAIAGGTAYIPSLPNEFITFRGNGGILQLGYATTSQEIVDVPAETDSETGEVITPAQTHTEYTYTPYDPSALIKNSTAAIGFDDQGTNCTWATALAESNTGGFIKEGAGTLTLSATPLYDGITWIKGGKIVFPEGTDVTLDPRSVGDADNADVNGYEYMANTVLYGTEPGSDVEGDVDVSGVVKIDISNSSFVDALVDDRVVVLCRTTGRITGLNSKKFVQGETLLVPEKPEGVPEKRWDWMVRVMQIGGKNCLCVAPRIMPFSIKLR